MDQSKPSLLILSLCLFSCSHRHDVAVTETEHHENNSQTQTLQEVVPGYPAYEFEYDINIPPTFTEPQYNQSLLFIDWSRCDQCPHMINYGKDIKIE